MTSQVYRVTKVTKSQFIEVYYHARQLSERIANATSPASEVADTTVDSDGFYLDHNGRYGFIVKANGELIALFSMLKGIGQTLVKFAIEAGAKSLDCFDGYLVEFYSKAGFMEVYREPNWNEGGADVVFMNRIF